MSKKNKTRKIDISKKLLNQIIHSNDASENLYIKKLTSPLPSRDEEVNVTWDFLNLREQILKKIPKSIYGWYHETTSSAGNSTFEAICSFSKVKIIPNYLNSDKDFSFSKDVVLHSNELGTTRFQCNSPFFTAPYGCASEYGGKSNEINTMLGTIKANGIYTLASFSKYNIEFMTDLLKKHKPDAFYMYQLYLTGDHDINISLIERAKMCGVSVIIITIDTGSNNHGGVGLLETQSDLTFNRNFCGNLLYDPVFNIKCYRENKCVGTTDPSIIKIVSDEFNVPLNKIKSSYDEVKSFDYAKVLQQKGMGNDFKHIVNICHSSTPFCKYSKIMKGVPVVIKGCMSVDNALMIQKSNVDGIYVSNHGGRFLYNSIAPLDVIEDIRKAVKKVNKHFGVWFDGGIRNGQDIFTAYAKGAEFVGIGRPIIYAGVLYGESGVSSITKKLSFELKSQCKLCGHNNLNNYEELKRSI